MDSAVPTPVCWRWRVFLSAAVLTCILPAQPLQAQERELTEVLDSLLNVRVHAAARHAQSQADAPASVTVITAEEIAAFGARTLAEVLARVPGFHVSYDHNYTYVGVRGFGRPTDYNSRTLVLLDGDPLNEGVYGWAPVGTDLGIDMGALQRIEVVRGPVSALYGGNAMIAVINLVTRSPDEPGAAVSVEHGNLDYIRASARGAARVGRRASVFVSGFAGREDGADLYFSEYDDGGPGGGFVRGRDADRYAGGLATATAGGFGVRLRASSRTKAVPTGAWYTDPADARNETTDRWVSVGASYARPIGPRSELSLFGSWQDYRYEGVYAWTDDLLHDATDNDRLFALVQLRVDPTPAQRLLFGASMSHHAEATYLTTYGSGLHEAIDEPYRVHSIFAQAELHFSTLLTLTAGARVDGQEHQETRITPRAALVVRPTGRTTLKFLYGAAFRPPNVYEQIYPAPRALAAGGLAAEYLSTGELVLEQQVGTGSLRVAGFTGRYRDLIDFELDPGTQQTLYDNVGGAHTAGVEVELTAPFGRWLLRTGGQLLHNHDDAGQPLTNAPARMAVLGVTGPVVSGLQAALQLRAESERIALDGSQAAAHALVDANLTFRPVSRLRMGLRTTNLFDTPYAYPGGDEHPQRLLPQEGRRIAIRIEYLQ